MKNLVTALALSIVLTVPALTFAATDIHGVICQVPPDRGIYSDDGKNTLVGCNTAEDVARARADAASQNAQKLPVVAIGTTVKDQYGVSTVCYAGNISGCYDITRTQEYRVSMQNLARQLLTNGWASRFPVFAGWIASVQ